MAAGLGFKTFTTGEVLTAADTNGYLMQGVLVFASAAARDAAITSPQEGQCCYLKDTDAVLTYSGSAWVGFDDSNAIQNAIVDAKGDIVAASAADTPARLAVGSNGETLVADSSTSTGLRYTAGNPIPNPVLNSAMQIAQRGTSFSIAASSSATYTLDRWQVGTGANQASTVSRQATGDTTNLPNIQYCLRFQRNSGQTGTGNMPFSQSMESINSIPFAGKTVTMSFYARAGANYSPTSSALSTFLVSGTGTDQNVNTAYTGGVNVINQTTTLTTTWQRFTYTGNVGATATELAVYFQWTPTGTASTNDYFEITGLQIDIGSVALPFRTNGSTIQGELAACQRYYESYTFGSDGVLPAQAISTTAAYGSLSYKVRKRGNPTIAATGGTFQVWNAGATSIGATFQADSIGVDTARVAAVSASGLVAGNAANLYFPSMTITISAEL
jgi:hypothetical protein